MNFLQRRWPRAARRSPPTSTTRCRWIAHAILAQVFVLSLLVHYVHADDACGSDKFSIKFSGNLHPKADEATVNVTVTLSPSASTFTFGTTAPTVKIYYGRFSACTGQTTCGPVRTTITATQSPGPPDNYTASFTYNQNDFTSSESDRQQGYIFPIYAVVTAAGGVTGCSVVNSSVAKVGPSASVEVSGCVTTPTATFKIRDSYLHPDGVWVLTVTGKDGFLSSQEHTATEFTSNRDLTLPITLGSIGPYAWQLIQKLTGQTDADGNVAASGVVIYTTAAMCGTSPTSRFEVLLPGDKPRYSLYCMPSSPITLWEKQLHVEPVNRIAAGQYYLTRSGHKYDMVYGDGTEYNYARSAFTNTFSNNTHAYAALGDYSFSYHLHYEEILSTSTGGTISATWKEETVVAYTAHVVEIAYTTNNAVGTRKAAASIQDAVAQCDQNGGGTIWVHSSSSNTENHVIDLSALSNTIQLCVRQLSGYIINGQRISYYGSPDPSVAADDATGQAWYPVSLAPRMLPKSLAVSGNLSTWTNPVGASDGITVGSATAGTGTTRRLASSGTVSIGDGTAISEGAAVTVESKPGIR